LGRDAHKSFRKNSDSPNAVDNSFSSVVFLNKHLRKIDVTFKYQLE